MESKIIEVLKINGFYFEIGDTISFTLVNMFGEWYGELLGFNDTTFAVLVDDEEKIYNLNDLSDIWK